jgi:sugar lactone lactonase YvrE
MSYEIEHSGQSRAGLLHPVILFLLAVLVCFLIGGGSTTAKDRSQEKLQEREATFSEFVWPPAPDKAHIRLLDVVQGRLDVEADSKFKRRLLGSSPNALYDSLKKPFAVAFDLQGRLLVTDTESKGLLRFDREAGRMDVLGTTGNLQLRAPMGLDVGPDGTIYVADAHLAKVVAFDPEGAVTTVYGKSGDLVNPTDALLSPDGKRLYVADSKAHKIVIFSQESGDVTGEITGADAGEFAFPTALAWSIDGDLLVVDQIKARVAVFTPEGEYLDSLGSMGVGFGHFSRPKDVAVDANGYIYVTDNAFNNVQIFDADFTLLTFVGEGGRGPGQFYGASGIAVHGKRFAVVDQLGRRLQLFTYLDEENG